MVRSWNAGFSNVGKSGAFISQEDDPMAEMKSLRHSEKQQLNKEPQELSAPSVCRNPTEKATVL